MTTSFSSNRLNDNGNYNRGYQIASAMRATVHMDCVECELVTAPYFPLVSVPRESVEPGLDRKTLQLSIVFLLLEYSALLLLHLVEVSLVYRVI